MEQYETINSTKFNTIFNIVSFTFVHSAPEMAFRGPSLVNRLVSHLQRFVGEEFVQKIIKPCTQNLIHMMKEEDIQVHFFISFFNQYFLFSDD
jgi:hypothetical protein